MSEMSKPQPRCPDCGQAIDPDVCWCGESKTKHGDYDNHTFVPMGCKCYWQEVGG